MNNLPKGAELAAEKASDEAVRLQLHPTSAKHFCFNAGAAWAQANQAPAAKEAEVAAKRWAEDRAGHRKGIIAYSDLHDAHLAGDSYGYARAAVEVRSVRFELDSSLHKQKVLVQMKNNLQAELARAKGELEHERMRLAACGVAAEEFVKGQRPLGDFPLTCSCAARRKDAFLAGDANGYARAKGEIEAKRKEAKAKGWWMDLSLDELREEFSCLEDLECRNQGLLHELGADICESSADGITTLGNILYDTRAELAEVKAERDRILEQLKATNNKGESNGT